MAKKKVRRVRKQAPKTAAKTAAVVAAPDGVPKTAVSPLNGAEIPLGAHPGNTGGKPGRSGRQPDWIKQFCDDVLAGAAAKVQVAAILSDKSHPAFARMWQLCADRAHGRPVQSVEIQGGLTLEQVVAASAGK